MSLTLLLARIDFEQHQSSYKEGLTLRQGGKQRPSGLGFDECGLEWKERQQGSRGCFVHCSVGRDSCVPCVSQRWPRKSCQPLPYLPLPGCSLWGCCSLVLVARVGGTKHLTLACLPSSSSGKSDRRKLGQTSPWYPVETKIFWVLLGSPILSLSTSFSSHLHILHAFLLSYISKRMGIFEGAESCQCHTQQATLAVQGHLGRGSGSTVKVACLCFVTSCL